MKKVYYYLIALLLLFTSSLFYNPVHSQSLDWAARFSRDVNGTINDYAILPDGSVIVLMFYDGRVKFEGVNGRITLGPNCNYCNSAFIARINNQGKAIWYKNWPNSSPAALKLEQIELDHNMDIIIAGGYQGSYDLDPSAGVSMTPNGVGLLLMKLDTNGTFINASTLAAAGGTFLYQFSAEHLVRVGNDFFMAGEFTTSLDLDPGPAINSVSESNPDENLYLVRYDSNLNFLNKNQLAFNSSDEFRIKAQTDGVGNVYLVHSGNGNRNPNSGDVLKRFNSALQNDSNINLDGIYINDFTFGTPAELTFAGYCLANSDFAIRSGSHPSTAEGYCLASYNRNGQMNWNKVFPNVGNNPLVRLESVTTDGQGNTIFGGEFTFDLYLDSNSTNPTNTRNTNRDGFFASFDSNGDFNWSYSHTATVMNSHATTMELRAENGKLYLHGRVLRNAMNFNPFGNQLSIPNSFTSLVIQGQYDPFMQKIDLGLITSLDNRSQSEMTVDVYPNPAVDELYISNVSKLQRVNLYTLSGQRIIDIQKPTKRIDLSTLSEGIYLMEMIGFDGERSMQKIVKQ